MPAFPPVILRPPADDRKTEPGIETARRRVVLADFQKKRARARHAGGDGDDQGAPDAEAARTGKHADAEKFRFVRRESAQRKTRRGIVDGGKQQLNVITRILKKNKIDIPVISISKGEGLRSSIAPDKIFFPGEKKPLELPLASPALHIIKRVRDEAHRFAIEYHRKIRGKSFLRR